jgi:hypothetical protein
LIGDIDLSKKTWDLQGYNTYIFAQDTTINIGEYELVDYRTLFDTIAKRNKVIMVNEAHHRPECRALTLEMLAKLKSEGFNYLGLEGLKEKTETLVQRGFPTLHSGFYIREPQYANLIRTALKLNYYFFGYDTLGGYRKIRELNQAKEIYKIIQKDSSAKVLIHAGWGHIREDTTIWGGLMGYEFKKLSKIDPFTIGQTRYMPMSTPVFENPLYAKLKHIKQPSVLVKKGSGTLYKDLLSDLGIFHPNNSMNYFFENNYRKYKFKNKHHEEGFIMIFPIHERIELLPVPSFIQELKQDTKTMLFYLPFSGYYNVYMMDKKSLRHIKKIKVL